MPRDTVAEFSVDHASVLDADGTVGEAHETNLLDDELRTGATALVYDESVETRKAQNFERMPGVNIEPSYR